MADEGRETKLDRASHRVLVVDAEPAVRQVIGSLLSDYYHVSLASALEGALTLIDRQQIDVVLIAQAALGKRVDESLEKLADAAGPDVPIYLLGTGDTAAKTKKRSGIKAVLSRQMLRTEGGRASLLLTVDRAAAARRQERETLFRRRQFQRAALEGENFLIGTSAATAALREEIEIASQSNLNLLLTGETGVGKTLVAERVHYVAGAEQTRPFVTVEPAALAPTLFESELFGHARGAFTGATSTQIGAFEAAEGGTLFLDEIGDLPHPLQVKLLRAVESKVIRRLGDSREITLNVRIIAATNRPLQEEVSAGNFRADLYQRLNECRLHIPPLKDRQEDIMPLLEHFVAEFSLGQATQWIVTPHAVELLTEHSWPGNVRELRTLARRLVERGLPDLLGVDGLLPLLPARLDRGDGSDLPPRERIQVFGRRVYLDELGKHGYSIRETARALDVPYATLRSRLKSFGLLEIIQERKNTKAAARDR